MTDVRGRYFLCGIIFKAKKFTLPKAIILEKSYAIYKLLRKVNKKKKKT